jgi:hypothetical protein
MKELAPILVNAFGWRAIARELVGAIPGFGFLARASISFAGTFALGKAAQTYYETGETVTRAQMKRLYEEAYASARDRVKAIAETLRRGGGEGGHRSRRPAAIASADDLTVDTQYAAADPVQAAGERTTPA